MMRSSWKQMALALSGAALLTGCAADDETVLGPGTTPVGGELFDRYVALGNSITAGFMSAGINDSTQALAYPVLLAQQAGLEIGTDFVVPFLRRPGCPPPLRAAFSTARVTVPGQTQPIPCALRVAPTRIPNNLAVPGAEIASPTDASVSANPLTTFILGGASPVQRMQALEPTLVTSWLGNNDVHGASRFGNTSLLLPTASFSQSLTALVAAISQTPAAEDDAVVLIGVVDPRYVPILQPGVFAFLVKQNPATAPLLPKTVSANCAPVGPTGQPNPNAFNFVSLEVLTDASVTEISCADRPGTRDYVVTPAEMAAISTRTAEFNAAIEAAADANGWMYVDPNEMFASLFANPAAVRRCQGLTPTVFAQGQAAIFQAVATTCPSPQAGFGALLSFDAFHPSPYAHRLVTNLVIDELNAKFGLSIPKLSIAAI
jgi:hypothetical protein